MVAAQSAFVSPGFVLEIESADGMTVISHRGGLSWVNARRPRRLHRCFVQTEGWIGFRLTQRCPCGAIRVDRGRWMERNRRKNR